MGAAWPAGSPTGLAALVTLFPRQLRRTMIDAGMAGPAIDGLDGAMHGQLAREFAAAATTLQDRTESKEIFEAVLTLASLTIPYHHAGLLLCHGSSELEPVQATDFAADEADHLQIALRQGPCWSCMSDAETITVDDLATEDRWQAWKPHLTTLGIRSILTTRLDTYDETVGVLTWYDETPHHLTPEAACVAHLVGMQAASALAHCRD